MGKTSHVDNGFQIIFENDICAVVSESDGIREDYTKERLLAHELVIEKIMKQATVIPVRFGTIAHDEETIRKILISEHDRYKTLLESLRDKTEIIVKAVFKRKVLTEHLTSRDQYIKELKSRADSSPIESSYYLRLEITKIIEEEMEREKKKYRKDILEAFDDIAEEVKTGPELYEDMILNAAFLTANAHEVRFRGKLNELGQHLGKYVGFASAFGIPPYSFANLLLNPNEYRE